MKRILENFFGAIAGAAFIIVGLLALVLAVVFHKRDKESL